MKSRRKFLAYLGAVSLPGFGMASVKQDLSRKAEDKLKDLRITRIRFYEAPTRSMVNQSAHIVTIETDQGITGIGEGGTSFLVNQLAGLLIGKNPLQTDHLWQIMYRGHFYPPGREKIHALGALDLALWDIKGKIVDVPVYMLLGGKSREHIECYTTAYPGNMSLREKAKAVIDDGFRAIRISVANPRNGSVFNPHHAVEDTVRMCEAVREGVGSDGDWCIDYHTRLDLNDAIRLSSKIKDLEPYFVEDVIRSENKELYHKVREKIDLPLAVGEHYGDKWDIHEIIEEDLIDYSRVSLPNAGGITEFQKISALCETHYVGLVPHFTGPVATAALIHTCIAFPGPVLMEILGKGKPDLPYLPENYEFRDGKLWPNERPGLGIEADLSKLNLSSEITEYQEGVPQFFRPDGSFTNW